MSTPSDAITGRPAWIADIVAAWGEPRVKADAPTRLQREGGMMHRRCWVWFIGDPLRNHNVHIDQYSTYFELGVACHCSHNEIRVRSKTEPNAELARAALAMAGWDLAAPTLEGAAE